MPRSPTYPSERNPNNLTLNRYLVRVTCSIDVEIDAPDPSEAKDRAIDIVADLGNVNNINAPGNPTLEQENVGTTK